MDGNSLTIVYHSNCDPSLELIKLSKDLKGYDITYIDIYKDNFETELVIDVVPILIINHDVFKGEKAFNKIKELNNKGKKVLNRTGINMYKNMFVAPPDDEKTKKKQVKFDE